MAGNDEQGGGIPVPPTHSASHFALALNASEILVTLAHSRVGITTDPQGGPPSPQPMQEWFLTLSLSPVAATHLVALLSSAINTYAEQFGAIPKDPKFQINVDDPKKK